MMVLYSGTTCPFSHRCRFVLFEKGMDFEIRDVDLYNKPEDISVMNPYGQVPILVERDLILYESNIINEYIDERFPHPQLMPGDPVDRARVRLFLLNFEKELFVQILDQRGICEHCLQSARHGIVARFPPVCVSCLSEKPLEDVVCALRVDCDQPIGTIHCDGIGEEFIAVFIDLFAHLDA